MKGMQKIKRGSGFLGVLTYATSRDVKVKWDGAVIGGNMLAISAAELATEFGLSRRIRSDIERPVWHNSLRLPQGDRVSTGEWAVMADDYMRRMGFSEDHQRVYILHDPEGVHGQHIHIIASRIGLSGEIYLGKNENLKSTKIISQLESDYGLAITKGVNYDGWGKIVMPAVAAPSKSELGIAIKRGERSERIKVKDVIDAVMLDGAISASDFCDRLTVAGIRVLPNISELTGGLSGFSFGLVDSLLNFSGSKIGAAYKLNGLEGRGLSYVKERDFQQLARITREFRGHSGFGKATGVAAAGFSDLDRGVDRRAVGGNEERSVAESTASLGHFEGAGSAHFPSGHAAGRERPGNFRANLVAHETSIRTSDKAGEAGTAFGARVSQDIQAKPKSDDVGTHCSRRGMLDDGFVALQIKNRDDAFGRLKARIEYRAEFVTDYFINISSAANLIFRGAFELLKLRSAGEMTAVEVFRKDPFLGIDFALVPNKSRSWHACDSSRDFSYAKFTAINNDFKKNTLRRRKASNLSYSI